jgi:hypothetical protein
MTPANPNKALAIPATVADLIERRFIQSMVLLLIALANVTGAASGAAEHNVSSKGQATLTWINGYDGKLTCTKRCDDTTSVRRFTWTDVRSGSLAPF